MEDALHDVPLLRRFAGLDAGESRMPDETTILNFRHLLEAQHLAESLFLEVVSVLAEQGLIVREGTIPEMSSSKKGNQWYVPFKRPKGSDTTPEHKRINRLLGGIRSAVEHPFRVLRCQFGYRKTRYRGLFKNERHLYGLCALVNLYVARRLITPTA
jgi:IS5 family transposase